MKWVIVKEYGCQIESKSPNDLITDVHIGGSEVSRVNYVGDIQ